MNDKLTIDPAKIRAAGVTEEEFFYYLYKKHVTNPRKLVKQMCSKDYLFIHKDYKDTNNTRYICTSSFTNRMETLIQNMKSFAVPKDIIKKEHTKKKDQEISIKDLAKQLKEVYPKGNRPGTTMPWSESTLSITARLHIFFDKTEYDGDYKEIIKATERYVKSFGNDKTYMKSLQNFIVTSKTIEGQIFTDSELLNFIERGEIENTTETFKTNNNADWGSQLV